MNGWAGLHLLLFALLGYCFEKTPGFAGGLADFDNSIVRYE